MKLAALLAVLAAPGSTSSWADVSRLANLVPSQPPTVIVREGLPGTDDWISGTAEAGCTVRVYTDATKGWLIGSVVAVDGRYELALGDDLYPSVYVTAGDAAGNETAGVVATNHLAWQPAPTVSVVQNPPGVEDRIRGVARPGTEVTVYSDSSLASAVATGVAGRDG
ncbi:MAG: hypothetical protein HY814_12170, partial [Candidatus Riflebacteria bacterium]|nr:hypothetical protein [Candidatus Riflebacteria bacterium]